MATVKGKTISKSGKEFNQAEVNRQAKALAENFAMIGDQLMDVIMTGVKKAGILVQGRAKKKVPVDTGLLKNSISERTERVDENTVLGEVGTNVEYAHYIEFGTGKYASNGKGRKTPWLVELPDGTGFWTHGYKPKPYLTPALYESKQDVTRIVQKAMKEALQ
jgi:HK97 gp10 family phage protein